MADDVREATELVSGASASLHDAVLRVQAMMAEREDGNDIELRHLDALARTLRETMRAVDCVLGTLGKPRAGSCFDVEDGFPPTPASADRPPSPRLVR
jgi:hypothetical protein